MRIVGAAHVERDAVVGDVAVAGRAGDARAPGQRRRGRRGRRLVLRARRRDRAGRRAQRPRGRCGRAASRDAVALSLARLDAIRSLRARAVADARRGRRHDGDGRAPRARERPAASRPTPARAEQSQLGGTIATNAGGPHAFKYGVTGDWVTGHRGGARAGRARARRRAGAQGRRRLRPARAADRLGGNARHRHRRLAAADARRPRRSCAVVAAYPDAAAGCAAILRVLASGVVPAALEFFDEGAIARRARRSRWARCAASSSSRRPTAQRPRPRACATSCARRSRRAPTRCTRPTTRAGGLALARRRLARGRGGARGEAVGGHRRAGRATRRRRSRRRCGSARATTSRRARGVTPATATCTRASCSIPATRTSARAPTRLPRDAVRARDPARRHGHRRARDRRAQGRPAHAAVGACAPSRRSARSSTPWTRRGCSTRARSCPEPRPPREGRPRTSGHRERSRPARSGEDAEGVRTARGITRGRPGRL